MIFTRRLKILCAFFLLILFSSSLFALEEYVSDVYREIDTVFVNKSDIDLENILKKNLGDKYYYLMENYSKKKVRRLIIDEDYEFAMTAIYIIIDNNIDGDFEDDEAVDMYSTIAEAYEVHQQNEQAKAEEERKAQEKKEAQNAKIRSKVQNDYVVAGTKEGKQVYLTAKDEKLSSYRWKADFNILTVGHVLDTASSQQGVNYGVSLDVLYEYILPTMTIGGNLFGDVQFLSMVIGSEEELPMLMNFDLAPKISFKGVGKNLFFRAGVAGVAAFKSETQEITSPLQDTLISPLVGLLFQDVSIGNASVTFGVDWLAGHIFKENLEFAAGAKFNVTIPFAELEKVKLNFNLGARDYIFIKSTGIENRVSAIIGFGVENVIR